MVELREVMNMSENWLLSSQDKDTGGWADRDGRAVSTLNTAETLIALLDGKVIAAGDNRIQKGVQFLLKRQCTEGPDRGAWSREFLRDHDEPIQIPDMVRTSFGIQALIKAGTGVNEAPVETAVYWLLAIKNKDNGWGIQTRQS